MARPQRPDTVEMAVTAAGIKITTPSERVNIITIFEFYSQNKTSPQVIDQDEINLIIIFTVQCPHLPQL